MEKTITDAVGGEIIIEAFASGRVGININDADDDMASSYLDRPQLRALIEALRQADAETRTEREIIVRREQGVTEAFGLLPGIAEEVNLGEMAQPDRDPANRDHTQAWAREYVAVRQWYGATIYLSGFPDEPTE